MLQNGEDCESAHTLVRNDPGYARLNADYFGLKNIKPDKLPPACLGSVFEVPQSSLQIDQACVSRGGAVRANSSPDIRDSCASRKSSDVYGFRPEYHTCVGFLILVTLAPWTHAWPRRHHYKCVRFAGSAQRHKELCPWRKRQPYLRKKHHHNKHVVQRQQQLQRQHNNQKQQQEAKSQRQQQQDQGLQKGLHIQRQKNAKPCLADYPDDRSRNVGCQARPVTYDCHAPPIHEDKDEYSMHALLGTTTDA